MQAKVFDPFFTTKGAGRGLGLALDQGIIRAHGGAISLRSGPRQGTTFQVSLPCMEDRTEALREIVPPVAEQLESLGATILIMEDEELLRFSVAKALRKIGFTVVEASEGSVALDLIRANRDSIDVVLLDVTLPGIPAERSLKRRRGFDRTLRSYSRARTERKLSMCRSLGCKSSISSGNPSNLMTWWPS